MRMCPDCKTALPESDFGVNRGRPDGLQRYCRIHTRARLRASYRKHQAEWDAKSLAYNRANPEKHAESVRRSKSKNTDRVRSYARYYVGIRRAAEIQATPKWLSAAHLVELRRIYAACPAGFHVDHIVPLKGKDVRGLHVPWNLQYLSAKDNCRKGNTYV